MNVDIRGEESVRFNLNEQCLASIKHIGDSSPQGCCCIVAVCGPVGLGKSTFLNALITAWLPISRRHSSTMFEAGNHRSNVTMGVVMFDGYLVLDNSDDPSLPSIKVILLDMQGSGLDTSGISAEISRYFVTTAVIATVMLIFTESLGLQQSDIKTCAKTLFHLSNIKKELEFEAGLASPAEPCFIIRLNCASLLHCNPSTSEGPPLLINKRPRDIMGFGANATAYVRTMLSSGLTDDGFNDDRKRICEMYRNEIHGIIYPLYEGHASYLDKCVASGVQNAQRLLLPSSETSALDEIRRGKVERFVQNMNEYCIDPIHKLLFQALRRKKVAGIIPDAPHLVGSAHVALLRKLQVTLEGQWDEQDIVSNIIELQLDCLLNEALSNLENKAIQILESLLTLAYETQNQQTADIESSYNMSDEQAMRARASLFSQLTTNLKHLWNEKAEIAKEKVNPLSLGVLQRNMINVTDHIVIGKIKNRFEADSRCVLQNIEEHLLKAIRDVLEESSALLEQSVVGDKQQEEILTATRNEIDEQTRLIKQELDRQEQEWRSTIEKASAESRKASMKSGSIWKTVVSMIASVAVSVFLPPALPLLSTGIVSGFGRAALTGVVSALTSTAIR